MVLRRFLGLPVAPQTGGVPRPEAPEADTATVREIVARLESLPPERARYLAGFAYVLSRAARADFEISDSETRIMEKIVIEQGGIPEAQAVIVVQIAKTQSNFFGATEDYLVTREFAATASYEEKLAALRCCYLVAADDGISAEETGTLNAIADQLDVDQHDLTALRAEFADQMNALRELRRRTESNGSATP